MPGPSRALPYPEDENLFQANFDEVPLRDLGRQRPDITPHAEPSQLSAQNPFDDLVSPVPSNNDTNPFIGPNEPISRASHDDENPQHDYHSRRPHIRDMLGADYDTQPVPATTSSIFKDNHAIDLAKGLRDALGGSGAHSAWLMGRPASTASHSSHQLPYPIDDDNEDNNQYQPTHFLTSQDRALRHSGSYRGSRSVSNSPTRPPFHRSASPHSEIYRRSSPDPELGFSISRNHHDNQLHPSVSPLHPSPRHNFSKAVQLFSNRIITGNATDTASFISRDSIARPSSALSGRHSMDDDDHLTSLAPNALSYQLPPRPQVLLQSTSRIAQDPSKPLLNGDEPSSSQIPIDSDGIMLPEQAQAHPLTPFGSNVSVLAENSSIASEEWGKKEGFTSFGVLADDMTETYSQIDSVKSSAGRLRWRAPWASRSSRPLSGLEVKEKPKVELIGKSLFIFKGTNRFRLFLYHALAQPWVMIAFLLVLIAHLIVLTVMTIPDVYGDDQNTSFFSDFRHSSFEWIIFGIYVFYTIHAISSIIAYGLIFDSMDSTINLKFRNKKYKILSMPNSVFNSRHNTQASLQSRDVLNVTSVKNAFKSNIIKGKFHDPNNNYNETLAFDTNTYIAPERAYLRSTWTRIDFVAIVGYWISFILQTNDIAGRLELYIFRALSGLPILRLLNITNRMSTILRSLKLASSRLITIFLFSGFFLTLFSIIGSQSFHDSLNRTCLWINPDNSSDTYNNGFVFCGSYINATSGKKVPFITSSGEPFSTAKGYTCPVNSVCMAQENPYGGTLDFDNFFNSLEIVFVIMSQNTYSDILYYIVDAEHLLSSLYFIIGIILLGYGLASLFISIIASAFRVIRSEIDVSIGMEKRVASLIRHRRQHEAHICRTSIGRASFFLREIPLLVIMTDLVLQSTVTIHTSDKWLSTLYSWQIGVTAFFVVEIINRFILYLPKAKFFFTSSFNVIDLLLAIANVIVILPFIHSKEELYRWFSFFQILRFYRIVVAVPYVRDIWTRVLGQYQFIFDVTMFYYTFTFIASIIGCLLLQGVVPTEENGGGNPFTFQTLGNAFVAMYTISSTENWTAIVYNAIQFTDSSFAQACIGVFFCAWLVMSNFVTINMFIAVLYENLELSIMSKRMEQIFIFFKQEMQSSSDTSRTKEGLQIFLKYLTPRSSRSDDEKVIFEKVVGMLKDTNISDFLSTDAPDDNSDSDKPEVPLNHHKPDSLMLRFIIRPWKKLRKRIIPQNPEVTNFRDLESYISFLRARSEQRKEQILKDPKYNKSLRIFSVNNPVRRFCQQLVGPSYGKRFEGQTEPTIWWSIFWVFMFAATLVLIAVAAIVTPIYYIQHLMYHIINWYVITEAVLFFIFTVEVFIKVIADGFIFAPNAYLKSIWGVIDFFVWLTLILNFVQEFFWHGQNVRIIRAFKALRALRLLTVNSRAQDLFNNIIILGMGKLFSAAVVALSILFPYAVWGVNVFRGRMYSCSDSNLSGSLNGCVGEFMNTPFNWEVKSPRFISNSYYNFDDFGNSLLMLFEIISLEGWVDVLTSAMSISGPFDQPQFSSGNYQGLFFIVYNTLSTIFIMTLFLSIIIQNCAKSSGNAYYTDTQRMWYELEKSLKTVRPSIRPNWTVGTFKHKLFKQFTTPYSFIRVTMFCLLLGIALVLISEYYPVSSDPRTVRWSLLMVFITAYLAFILLKIYAFGTKRYFRRKWDLYAFIVTCGSFPLKFIAFFIKTGYSYMIVEKLFYVGMTILIITHSRRLDQLLKTAAASIPNMAHLLLVWVVLYFTFGIAFNQVLGLTRFGAIGTVSINVRTVPNALVLLFRMSCGEGWNQILYDYLVEAPYCYENDTNTDCGSKAYAFILFISWNIISMYIFANLLVSMIYEQFSYLARPEDPPINREKIRQFKDAWQKFDTRSRGFIDKSDLRSFLYSLDGYFSMRIHMEPWSLRSILYDSKCVNGPEIDIPALRQHMRRYPKYEVAQRRERCEQFYYHAMELSDDKGHIGFHDLLLLFPFYNDMDYTQCLDIRDYLHYTNILQTIKEKRRADKIIGFKKMIAAMLKYQKALRDKRNADYEREAGFPIPTLRVDMVDFDSSQTTKQLLVQDQPSLPAPAPPPIYGYEDERQRLLDDANNNEYDEATSTYSNPNDDQYSTYTQRFHDDSYASAARPNTEPNHPNFNYEADLEETTRPVTYPYQGPNSSISLDGSNGLMPSGPPPPLPPKLAVLSGDSGRAAIPSLSVSNYDEPGSSGGPSALNPFESPGPPPLPPKLAIPSGDDASAAAPSSSVLSYDQIYETGSYSTGSFNGSSSSPHLPTMHALGSSQLLTAPLAQRPLSPSSHTSEGSAWSSVDLNSATGSDHQTDAHK